MLSFHPGVEWNLILYIWSEVANLRCYSYVGQCGHAKGDYEARSNEKNELFQLILTLQLPTHEACCSELSTWKKYFHEKIIFSEWATKWVSSYPLELVRCINHTFERFCGHSVIRLIIIHASYIEVIWCICTTFFLMLVKMMLFIIVKQ